MPLYNRYCNTCDEVFDAVCKISEKDTIQIECPFCASTSGEWRPNAPAGSMRSERFMTHKKDAGFGEVISKIKERNKRTSITDR